MPYKKSKSKAKAKSNAPEYGWQNVSLVERDNGKLSGYLNITPEFLDEIAERIENDELDYDEERNTYTLGITLRENENKRRSTDATYLGNVYLFDPVDEEEEEEPPKSKRRSRYDDEEEEEEEERPTRRRKSRTTSRARVR